MLDTLKWEWRELTNAPAGARFAQFYERQQVRRTPIWNSLRFFAAVFTLVVGVTMVSEILPALLLLSLSGMLFVGESRWVAETFDAIERFMRRGVRAPRVHTPVTQAEREPTIRPSRVRGERYNSHLLAMDAARALLREQMSGPASAPPSAAPRAESEPPAQGAAAAASNVAAAAPDTAHASDDIAGLEHAARSYVALHAREPSPVRASAQGRPVFERAAEPARGTAVRRARSTPAPTIKLWSRQLHERDAAPPSRNPVRYAGLVKSADENRAELYEAAQPFAPTAPMPTIVVCPPPVLAAESER